MNTIVNTGVIELRSLYRRYLTESLLIAGLFHVAIIGGTRAMLFYYNISENIPSITFHKPNDWIFIDAGNKSIIPNVSVAKTNNLSVGTPIPIPETEISPEATIDSQNRTTESTGNSTGVVDGTGNSIFNGTFNGEEEIPPEPFTAVEIMPVPISNPAPQYPEIAKRAFVEGTVYINMWVTKEGKVRKAKVVKSTSNIFDQAAIDAAMLWTFTPAIMNNGPVSVWVTVPFKFRLRSN